MIEIINYLVSGIESGSLVTNGKLKTERELAKLMGVSRANVRQALRRLELNGIIWRRQGRGTFVGVPQDQGFDQLVNIGGRTSAAEIIEVRKELEPILVKLAAMRATPRQKENIHKAYQQTVKAKDASEYERWDSIFHRMIAEASNNILFLAMFDAIQEVRHQESWSSLRETKHSKEIQTKLVNEHRLIYEAILDNDVDKAKVCMTAHLASVAAQFNT